MLFSRNLARVRGWSHSRTQYSEARPLPAQVKTVIKYRDGQVILGLQATPYTTPPTASSNLGNPSFLQLHKHTSAAAQNSVSVSDGRGQRRTKVG